MTVLYFQIAIFLSILIGYGIKQKKGALIAATGWTVESLLLLTIGSHLFFTQMCIIWLSYFFIIQYWTKVETIKKLKEIISEYNDITQIDILNATKNSKIKIIHGSKHKKVLKDAINDTRMSLLILSGWISDLVIDDQFINDLKKSIKRGVKVYIGYGYQDSKGYHNDNNHTINALTKLRMLYREGLENKFSGRLFVSTFPNHQKIIIKDNDYIICGSTNWLSNKAYKNEECSVIIFSSDLAQKETQRIKQLIKDNNPNYQNEQL